MQIPAINGKLPSMDVVLDRVERGQLWDNQPTLKHKLLILLAPPRRIELLFSG
jgi:hypothetical protein